MNHQSLSSFIWSVADLLRGDYKQSDYGMLALSRTTEAEIDQGRWSHDVVTHDGPRRVTLAIPDLLRPLEGPPDRAPQGLPDRRVMERMLLEVQRFAETREFASESEMNEALQANFVGSMDSIVSTDDTPLGRAQDLAYRAMDARGRRRIQLARKALELSADCADAYVLLAEASADPAQVRDLYAQGVAAGERTLGPGVFEESAGHFWADVRTRPYIRARFGLARSLWDLGERDEALPHYREILRLNPSDNLGARYAFLNALLLSGRDDEAGALLLAFGDEPSALWQYGRGPLRLSPRGRYARVAPGAARGAALEPPRARSPDGGQRVAGTRASVVCPGQRGGGGGLRRRAGGSVGGDARGAAMARDPRARPKAQKAPPALSDHADRS